MAPSARSHDPGQPAVRTPVPAWAPLVWFAVLGSLLTVVVVTALRPPGPLDQPDPAYQRDGLLRDGPRLAPEVGGVSFGGRPVVLLFVRRPPAADALQRWAADVPARAELRVVLPEPPPVPLPVASVVDGSGLSEAVGMPTPRDGGRPVGYAVVDSGRTVRYATLDPDYLDNGFEVATMAGAVR